MCECDEKNRNQKVQIRVHAFTRNGRRYYRKFQMRSKQIYSQDELGKKLSSGIICCFLATSIKTYFSPNQRNVQRNKKTFFSTQRSLSHNYFLFVPSPVATNLNTWREQKSMHTQRMENPVESNKVRYKIILCFVFYCQQFFPQCCFSLFRSDLISLFHTFF